jgi:hypothetical protein
MAKLPTRDELGGLRVVRPATGFSAPSIKPMQSGIAALTKATDKLGRTAVDVGVALLKKQEQAEDYDTKKRLIEFKRATERDFLEYQREIAPGGEGFQGGWEQRYKKRADDFFGTQGTNFPLAQRQKVDTELLSHGERLSTLAHGYEIGERDRFAKEEMETLLGTLKKDVEGVPAALNEKLAEGLSLIDSSRLRAPDKYTARKRFKTELDKTAALSAAMGAATGEEFRSVERALFTSVPVKPQPRDRSGSDFLPRRAVSPNSVQDASLSTELPTFSGLPAKGYWGDDPTWAKLTDVEKAAAMALLEADAPGGKIDIAAARNVLATMINRADKDKKPLGEHVSSKIYQPTIEPAQYARLARIVGSPAFHELADLARARLSGEVADWVAGSTHFIAPEPTMLALEARQPEKYRSWRTWTGFDERTRQYGGVLFRDGSHVFLAPEGRHIARFRPEGEAPPAGGELAPPPIRSAADRGLKGPAALGGEPTEEEQPSPRARLPGAPEEAKRVGGDPTRPRPVWVSEEEGSAAYAGPYQNLSLAERKAVWSQLETRRKQIVAGLTKEVQDWEKVASSGFALPEPLLADLTERVEQAGDTTLTAYFQSTLALASVSRQLSAMRPVELEGILTAERTRMLKEGATPVAVKRLEHSQSVLASMREGINADPLAWASKVGLIELSPIDFAKPETLERRAEAARAVARYYAQEPRFFTRAEREQVANLVRSGGPALIGTLERLHRGLGSENMVLAVREVAKESPELASVGWLLARGGSAAAIKDAAEGLALKRVEGFKSLAPSPNEAHDEALTELGGALKDFPQSATRAGALTNTIYESRARREGQPSVFNRTIWKQALREALGEHDVDGVTYGGIVGQSFFGGSRILLPPSVRKDSWKDVVDMITPADLAAAGLGTPVGGDGKEIAAGRLRSATLVQIDDGKYLLATGDPDSKGQERFVKRDNGADDFVLDLHKLAPILSWRRPELFSGQHEAVSERTGGFR